MEGENQGGKGDPTPGSSGLIPIGPFKSVAVLMVTTPAIPGTCFRGHSASSEDPLLGLFFPTPSLPTISLTPSWRVWGATGFPRAPHPKALFLLHKLGHRGIEGGVALSAPPFPTAPGPRVCDPMSSHPPSKHPSPVLTQGLGATPAAPWGTPQPGPLASSCLSCFLN